MASKWKVELIFLLMTLALALLIIQPIKEYMGSNYEFYTINYIYIFVFLTFSRYILLLHYTPFSHSIWTKVILVFLCIPLFFYLMDGQYNFQQMLDEKGLEPLVLSNDIDFRWNFAKYAKYQFLFFSTGALMVVFMMPFRMIRSIWRIRNKGLV
jgi:hypothetical protein